MEHKQLRVTVVDMQPITPAVGGGRQRLLGLYHALGPNIDCTYVGTYDWQGEHYYDQQITPGLREIVVPLSPEHHAAAAELACQMDGRTVIDLAFPDQVRLSPDFLHAAREHMASADIVVFSHPWCYPPLADALRAEQLTVYESHNVEAVLRASLHDDLPQAKALLNRIAEVEYALCQRADLVLACSQEDADQYVTIMDVDPFKLRIVPNGAFTERFDTLRSNDRSSQRGKLDLPIDKPVAIFLGSMYGPNVEAAEFIARALAPRCLAWTFVIAGGAGEVLRTESIPSNLIIAGRVDDKRRDELLLASDLALNPMRAGSGTNIKMFDYMAAGLPILTTAIGARGICTAASAPDGVSVESAEQFPARCSALLEAFPFPPKWKASVRETARRCFSWERISPELGKLLSAALVRHLDRVNQHPRVALMSTWNVVCGIGEHSKHLAESLTKAGADLLVLGNKLDNHRPVGFEQDMHTSVSRTWTWDNLYWRSSAIDLKYFNSLLRLGLPDLLVVQHHTAYVPFADVISATDQARELGIPVIVEMHNARHVSVEHKEQLNLAGAKLLLHHADEVAGMSQASAARAWVSPLPIYVPHAARVGQPLSSRNGSHVIGGFGFLRPYKGVLMAIRVLALLRNKYPRLRYHGWHAMYPGDSSEEYLRLCLHEAERLDIRHAIKIDTRFLPIDEAIVNLRSVDVVLMPYDTSEEGASAAANMAIAAARPVIASPSSIFKSASEAGVIRTVEEHIPEAYAEAIDRILSDLDSADALACRAAAWAEAHSYDLTAKALLKSANAHTSIREML